MVFIVYFGIIFGDLTCAFLSGIQDFMHLLCIIISHDISNNLITPFIVSCTLFIFIWQDLRVKHVRTYVFYIVFPIFLLLVWERTFL